MSTQPADDARDPSVPTDAETPPPEGQAPPDADPRDKAKRPLFRRRDKAPEIAAAPVNPAPVTDEDTRASEDETTVIPVAEEERGPGAGRLRRRRRELVDQRQEVVYHLGGLAFELYRRDLLREAVMRRRAAEVWGLDESVRDIDRQLEAIEHSRKERREDRRRKPPPEPVPLGHCIECGSPWYQADARFCWHCGAAITRPEAGADDAPDAAADDQPTTVIGEREEGS